MAAGKHIGAFCLTEANAGSDAGGVETTATKTEDGYSINGTKIFVTNGGVCDVVLVFAVNADQQGPSRPNVLYCGKEVSRVQCGRNRGFMRHAGQSGLVSVF